MINQKIFKNYEFSQNLDLGAQNLSPPCPFQSLNSQGRCSLIFWEMLSEFYSSMHLIGKQMKFLQLNFISNGIVIGSCKLITLFKHRTKVAVFCHFTATLVLSSYKEFSQHDPITIPLEIELSFQTVHLFPFLEYTLN